jgi:hypothetical protein
VSRIGSNVSGVVSFSQRRQINLECHSMESNAILNLVMVLSGCSRGFNHLKTEGILRKLSKSDLTHPKVEGFQK